MTGRSISTLAITTALAAVLGGCGDRAGQSASNRTAAKDAVPIVRQDATPTPATIPSPRSIMQPSVIPEPTPTTAPLAPLSETVQFAGGGARLDDAAIAALDELIANPTTASGGPIVLRGSSDSVGSDTDNLITSRKRAEAVAAYLKAKGIAPDRLTVVALGDGRPIAPNVNLDGSDNPEGRARNRRVDVEVTPTDGASNADPSKTNDQVPQGAQ